MAQTDTVEAERIRAELIEYIQKSYITGFTRETLPLDRSLVELGVLDSFGIVELVTFLEDNWSIVIKDEEITRERMGSINKMVDLICEKTGC